MDATLMFSSAPGAVPAAASDGTRPALSSDGDARPNGLGFPALLDEATGHQGTAVPEALSSAGAVVEGAAFVDWWMMFPLTAQAAAAPVAASDGVGDEASHDAIDAAPNGDVEADAALDAESAVPAMVAGIEPARPPAAIVASVWGGSAERGASPGIPAGVEPGTGTVPKPGTMPGVDGSPQPAASSSTPAAGLDAGLALSETTPPTVEVGLHGTVHDSVPAAAGSSRPGTSEEPVGSRRVMADTNAASAGDPASVEQGSAGEPLAAATGTLDQSSPDGGGDRQPSGSSPERRQDSSSAGEPAKPGPAVAIHGSAFVRGADAAATLSAAGMPAATDVPAVASTGPSQETLHHLVQAMRMQFRNGIGEAVLRLNPEHLGAVSIALRVEQGAVSATVVADAPNVRRWLETQEPALRQGLAAQGLHLDRLTVEPDERHSPHRRQASEEPQRRAPKHHRETSAAVFDVVV